MVIQDEDKSHRNVFRRLKLYSSDDNVEVGADEKKRSGQADLKPSVSFNTVPSYAGNSELETCEPEFVGVQFPPEYSMEEFYDNESGYSDNNKDYCFNNHYITDPTPSSLGRRFSPPPRGRLTASIGDVFKIAGNGKIVRTDYPSKPSITSNAMIINRVQGNWASEWHNRKEKIDERLLNKEQYFQKPDLIFPQQQFKTAIMKNEVPLSKEMRRKDKIMQKKVGFSNSPRTIICHISGRRHTWVALDWMLRELVHDTDHIVVVANLPKLLGKPSKMNRFNSDEYFNNSSPTPPSISTLSLISSTLDSHASTYSIFSEDMNDEGEWCSGYDKAEIELEIRNIFKYIKAIVTPNIALKITVEIIVAKTSRILCDVMNVYTPDFIIGATLKWQPIDNIVVWKSKKIVDQLATNFPIPLFIVPAQRMYYFEKKLQCEGSFDANGIAKLNCHDIVKDISKRGDFDDVITTRMKPDITSHSMEKRLKQFSKVSRQSMVKKLDAVESESNSSKGTLKIKRVEVIFNASLRFAREIEYMKGADDSESEFENWKRFITGGNVRPVISNTKSMLDVETVPKKARHHSHHSSKPTSSTKLKFASDVKKNNGVDSISNKLTRSISYTPDTSSGRRSADSSSLNKLSSCAVGSPLAKVKRQQQSSLRRIKSNSNVDSDVPIEFDSTTEKKKSGGFFSFFKRG